MVKQTTKKNRSTTRKILKLREMTLEIAQSRVLGALINYEMNNLIWNLVKGYKWIAVSLSYTFRHAK
jgi:hypothetical protein